MIIKRHYTLLVLSIYAMFLSCASLIPYPQIKSETHPYVLDYTVSPTNVDSVINVKLELNGNLPECSRFLFPIQIPGAYEIKEYRKFIKNLKVTNINGTNVKYAIPDDSSSFEFLEPTIVKSLSYDVIHTFGSKKDSISGSSGTVFKKNLWHISPHAVFGFFKETEHKAIRIKLDVPEHWITGTSLMRDSSGYYYASDYSDLLTGQILSGDLTHKTFSYGNSNYYIYSYSGNPGFNAKELKGIFKDAVEDADNFLGGFPTKDYVFLVMNFPKKAGLFGTGALEYLKSSFYTICSYNISDVENTIGKIVRHELFHVLAPLSLKGREISDMDYITPHPVKNLWFYEGLTQWATFKMRLMNNSFTTKDYLNIVRNNLMVSQLSRDTCSLIELSENTFENRKGFVDIYRRGFILGTMLDLYIIQKTSGKETLRTVLLKMRDKYPINMPFETDSIYSILASLSHPDVKRFCIKYINNNEPFPIETIFNNVGITYNALDDHPILKSDFDFFSVPVQNTGRFVIQGFYPSAEKNNPFKKGDTLISIDDSEIIKGQPCLPLNKLLTSVPGRAFSMKLKRGDKFINVIDKSVVCYRRHTFKQDEFTGIEQQRLFDIWRHESMFF